MIEEITIQELAAMEPSACQIIDMRDSTAFALGHIDGAVLIPQKELEASHENLPKDKTLVIYCRSGILSADVAEQLREEGYAAVNLVGGYVKWLQENQKRKGCRSGTGTAEKVSSGDLQPVCQGNQDL